MTCLKNYIGFKWCQATEPESGLWLNTLPGVSLKSIDNLADEEQRTFLGVWSDVQDRAITKLNAFVTNYFAKRYKLNSVIESLSLGKRVDATDHQTPASAQYRGISLALAYSASPLQLIYVQSLALYLKATTSGVVVKFFDVSDKDHADEVFSLTRDMVPGWNFIMVNKTFDVQQLFIGYDASAISSIYQSLDDNYPFDFCDENCFATIGNSAAYVRGATTDIPYGNLQSANNTYGLTGVFGVQCSYEALICANKNVFKTALWYLEGAEAMFERMYSDRLNRYTTVDRPRAEELYTKYLSDAQTELNNAIEGIQLKLDSCLSCDAPLTTINNLP